jgi:adenosylcobyric acid synthase
MLGRSITDEVEADAGTVAGLGILALDVIFAEDKVLRQATGIAYGQPVAGYEIHHGRVAATQNDPLLVDTELGEEGSVDGAVVGTHWHGLFASDEFRRDYLRRVAEQVGRTGFVVGEVSFEQARMAQLDLIADLVETELDMGFITDVIAGGPTRGLPTLTTTLG